VPIPGTKRRTYLSENAGAVDVVLTPDQAAEVGELMRPAAGARYATDHVYGDSPARS